VKRDKVEYAPVIVFLRQKEVEFMLIHNEIRSHILYLNERRNFEIAMSIEAAYELCDLLDKRNVDLEMHADINTDLSFSSHSVLKDAMGYILGIGFVSKAKPDAFTSSSYTDRVVF
jgi:predicted RNase H-related nuclease YkuK (DUF458 family)